MSTAGALFAGAITALVAAGVWVEVFWRGRRPAPAALVSVPGFASAVAPELRRG